MYIRRTKPSQNQSHPTLADEPFAAAMATLSTRSMKERMLIGKLLLVMTKASPPRSTTASRPG